MINPINGPATTAVPPTEPVWQNTVQVSSLSEIQDAVANAGVLPTRIQVISNIVTYGLSIAIPGGATIKLTSLGGPYTLDAEGNGRIISNEGTFYLSNLTLANAFLPSHGGCVENNGTFVLQDGGRITNASVTNGYSGAGVHCGLESTFIMTGGEIDHNHPSNTYIYGAGVASMGDVQIFGGSIHDNTTSTSADGGGDGGGLLSYTTVEIYGGEIHHNSARSGGGVRGQTVTMYGGSIRDNVASTNYAPGSDGGGGIISQTFTMLGGSITGNQALGENSGGGVYVTQYGVTRIEGGTISGNISANEGGGIFVSCDWLENLFVGKDAIFSGNSAIRAYNRRQQDNGMYAMQIAGTNWTSPFVQGYNGYDIAYPCGDPFAAPAEVVLAAQKNATGADLPAGLFQFGVFDDAERLLATTTNGPGGIVTFPAIPIHQISTRHYVIREISSSGNGWIVDTSEFPVTVVVTDNGFQQLVAEVTYPEGQPVFTNTYAPVLVSAEVQGTKAAMGAALAAGQFSFGLFDESGAQLHTTTNDASGRFSFTLALTSAGTHAFTVKELTPSQNGWTTDARVFPVHVTVTSNGNGQPTATVTYPSGEPAFVNTYRNGGQTSICIPNFFRNDCLADQSCCICPRW